MIAIPMVEVVTCSFDVTKQSFWENDIIRPRFVQQEEEGIVLLHPALNEIEFEEERSVFRCGDVGVAHRFQQSVSVEHDACPSKQGDATESSNAAEIASIIGHVRRVLGVHERSADAQIRADFWKRSSTHAAPDQQIGHAGH